MSKSRLYDCLRALGWQGGTAHQVNEIASHDACMGHKIDINKLSIEEWNEFIPQFERYAETIRIAPKIYQESKQ